MAPGGDGDGGGVVREQLKMSHSEDLPFPTNTTRMREMQRNAYELLEKISYEQETYRVELESRRVQFLEREKELEKRVAENREMEKQLAIMLEIEKKLAAKQAVELEIECAIKRIYNRCNAQETMINTDVKKEMERIQQDLKEKEEDLEAMEKVNHALVIKEIKYRNEILDAREELITAFKDSSSSIGVKKLGELDSRPFYAAALRTYSNEEAEVKAAELCSLWEDYLRDANWHPFKVVNIEGITKEVIDEDDEKLKELRIEFGEEVFKTVITALLEMSDYNHNGRYVVTELWNFQEARKASLKEAAAFLLKQFKSQKRKKKRS